MKIHMSAICGMGMGSLAQLLKASGHEVTGSDKSYYPPMSTLLEGLGIEIKTGFNPDNISPDTDLVIVGNAVKKENPEAIETLRRGLKYYSFPKALDEMYLKDKTSIVVAGTHGKTTTCTLIAWILETAGLDPSFLIGGILRDLGSSSKLGSGRQFVVEGDEYDTAFFDKGPKFLHYRPHIGILTSIEFEHADIFNDITDCKKTFAKFVELIPTEGKLIGCSDNPAVLEVCKKYKNCPIEFYGEDQAAQWRLADYKPTSDGSSFKIVYSATERFDIQSPLAGKYNALNTVAAFAAAYTLGVKANNICQAIKSYRGVKRRQEIRGVADDIVVIDDFAHHPTEVSATITAMKELYAGRRLWAIWEPRTNSSRRNFFQNEYPSAFSEADLVIVAGVYRPEQIEPEKLFSPEKLVEDLTGLGCRARYISKVDDILKVLLKELQPGDIVLVMSNGAFGNIHVRLLDGLRNRRAGK